MLRKRRSTRSVAGRVQRARTLRSALRPGSVSPKNAGLSSSYFFVPTVAAWSLSSATGRPPLSERAALNWAQLVMRVARREGATGREVGTGIEVLPREEFPDSLDQLPGPFPCPGPWSMRQRRHKWVNPPLFSSMRGTLSRFAVIRFPTSTNVRRRDNRPTSPVIEPPDAPDQAPKYSAPRPNRGGAAPCNCLK